ncbi:nSTAND1 domain-containing NTPase [Brachybacterium sp. DNPG3]
MNAEPAHPAPPQHDGPTGDLDGEEAGASPRAALDRSRPDGVQGVVDALRHAKEAAGLSYRKLTGLTGISTATLQGWLSGRYVPQLSMRAEFEKLVDVVGLTDPAGTPGGITAADWWDALRVDPGRKKQIPPPYPGVRPYDVESAAAFVGREELLAALQERIARRLAGEESPLLLVTGRSGVGKSSAVAAAVGTLPPAVGTLPATSTRPAGAERELRREIVSPGMLAIEALARVEAGECDVLVLDHAEMLWTGVSEAVRDEILERLARLDARPSADARPPAACPPAAVVVVLRADAVAPATDVDVLRRALEDSAVVVGPITERDAVRIIAEPPRRAGIVVEPGLVEIILRDAGATGGSARGAGAGDRTLVGVLPLLSQTMRSLWLDRADPERIAVEDYRRSGGLARSVEHSAEAAYAQLSDAGRAKVWAVLREMIRQDTPVPTRRTVAVDGWTDPGSLEVLEVFLPARLLTSDADGITLGHDLLLTAWPRLANWLEAATEWSTARQLLARFAAFWDESGRPDDLLASRSAAVLLDAHEQAGSRPGGRDRPPGERAVALAEEAPYTRLEREFLEAGRGARDAMLQETEADNRRLRSSRSRFRIVAAAASVLLVIAMIAAGVALAANRGLAEARAVALSGQIALYSDAAARTMPAEAAQLAVAAYTLDDNTATRGQLLSQTAAPLPRRLLTAVGPADLASAGDLLVRGGAGGELRIYSASTGELRTEITAPVTNVYAVSLVDTGDRILLAASGENLGGADGGAADGCLWDVTGAPYRLGCTLIPAKSDAVLVLDDGSGVLFGAGDGTIVRLAVDGDEVTVLDPFVGPLATAPDDAGEDGTGEDGTAEDGTAEEPVVSAVRALVSADGILVVAGYDGSVALLADPLGDAHYTTVRQLPGLQSLALSADGTRYAISTRDSTLELGSIVAGEIGQPTAVAEFESWVNQAAFLPDGRVAAVSSDQSLRVFAADGTELQVQETASLLTAVELVGSALVTSSIDGVVSVWPAAAFADVESRGRLFEVVAGSQDQQVTASLGEDDGKLRAARLQADGTFRPLAVPALDQPTSYGIGMTQDASMVATGGWDGDLHLWAIGEASLSEPVSVQAMDPGSLITYIRFNPSGTRLAVAAQNSAEVLVLDVDPGADGADGAEAGIMTEALSIPVTAGGTLTFLDDDTLALDDGHSALQIWDVAAGEQLGAATVDGDRPSFVLARPGHPGQIGFTMSDLSVGIMDLSDPSDPQILSRISKLTDNPLSLDFTSDGGTIAIAAVSAAELREVSDDGEISATGLRLTGPADGHITDVAFLGGDTRLAASTYTAGIWRWDLDPERATATICSRIGDPLTEEAAVALAPTLPEDAAMCG